MNENQMSAKRMAGSKLLLLSVLGVLLFASGLTIGYFMHEHSSDEKTPAVVGQPQPPAQELARLSGIFTYFSECGFADTDTRSEAVAFDGRGGVMLQYSFCNEERFGPGGLMFTSRYRYDEERGVFVINWWHGPYEVDVQLIECEEHGIHGVVIDGKYYETFL